MPRTLRQHVHHAESYFTTLGVKTLVPTKEPPAPIKVDASPKQLIYAVSIRLVVERCDSTGYMGAYLRASKELREEMWRRIPERSKDRMGKDMRRARKALRKGGIPVDSRS